jgi:membrane-associated protein
MACFVPIVRTFTPIVAGVSRMNYRTFATFNILGGTLWGAGVTLLGYWLGQIAFVRDNIEAILVLVVLVSVVPVGIEILRSRGKSAAAPADEGAGSAAIGPDSIGPEVIAATAPRGGRHRAQKR